MTAAVLALAIVTAPSHELIEAGTEAFMAKEYEAALIAFTRAAKDLPDRPRLIWNVGRCLEELGRTEEALEKFEQYIESEPDDTKGLREALNKVAKLRAARAPKSATVRVESVPPSANIRIDGEPVGRSPIMVQVPAGTHTVTAQLDGHLEARAELQTEAGKAALVALAMQPAPKASPPPMAEPAPSRSWLAPAALGATGALLTALAVHAFLDQGEHEEAASSARALAGIGDDPRAAANASDADDRAALHGTLGWTFAAAAATSLGWASWMILAP